MPPRHAFKVAAILQHQSIVVDLTFHRASSPQDQILCVYRSIDLSEDNDVLAHDRPLDATSRCDLNGRAAHTAVNRAFNQHLTVKINRADDGDSSRNHERSRRYGYVNFTQLEHYACPPSGA